MRFAPGAMKLKEIITTAGIAAIYGLLIAGVFLMPIFSIRTSMFPHVLDCSWTYHVQVNGYGSGNVFGGTVCYEQYYDLMKCLKQVDENYRNDLDKANSILRACNFNCNVAAVISGIGCVAAVTFSWRIAAIPCYWIVLGTGVGCLSYCRADYMLSRSNAKSDADTALQNCFTAHEATPAQLGEPNPYAMPGSGPEHRRPRPPDNGAIIHDDRMWRAN